MPLSEAVVLFLIYPVITSVLASVMLGEVYEMYQLFNTAMCLMGVILVVKPPYFFPDQVVLENPQQTLGLICCFINAFVTSMVIIFIRKLGGVVNPFTTTHYFGFFGAIFSPIVMIICGVVSVGWNELFNILMVGFLGYMGQVFVSRAYIYEKAARLAVMGYSQVFFSYIFDILILGFVPNVYSVIGSLCISSSVVFMIYSNKVEEKKKSSKPAAGKEVVFTDSPSKH